MNKQIAIDILEKEKAYMQQHAGKAQVEAFDMAICALRISEQEIRAKAIDTFVIAIETLMKLQGAVALSEIQEIAEKLKGEAI